MLRETTSRGPCGLVWPSRTSERGGEGDCVKKGGEQKGSARGSVHWGCDYATGRGKGETLTSPCPPHVEKA